MQRPDKLVWYLKVTFSGAELILELAVVDGWCRGTIQVKILKFKLQQIAVNYVPQIVAEFENFNLESQPNHMLASTRGDG